MLLCAYPRDFRARFGREMRQDFRDRCQAAFASDRAAVLVRFFFVIAQDWLLSAGRERIASMRIARGLAMAALTILVSLFVFTTFLQAFVVPTGSMEGSLLVGDHILVN